MPPGRLCEALPADAPAPHTACQARRVLPSSFLKAKALNTAILFTDLHVRQKQKREPQRKTRKQGNTLKKITNQLENILAVFTN